MSTRRGKITQSEKEVAKLRKDLDELKTQARATEVSDVSAGNVNSHEFDQLNATEQSAASLGVSPDAWKPIAFLNNGHYDQLIKANMLDDKLARRIEVSWFSSILNRVQMLTPAFCVCVRACRLSRPLPRPLLKMTKPGRESPEGCVGEIWLMWCSDKAS